MKEAAKLLHEMAKKGIVQDDITYIVFMNRNCKEGNMEEVVEVCNQMSSKGILQEIRSVEESWWCVSPVYLKSFEFLC